MENCLNKLLPDITYYIPVIYGTTALNYFLIWAPTQRQHPSLALIPNMPLFSSEALVLYTSLTYLLAYFISVIFILERSHINFVNVVWKS